MLFDWDPRANQAIFGAEVERITGYTAAELSGPAPRWLAIVHPDDVRLAREAAEAVQAGSTAIHLSHRIIRRDGSIADVEIEGRMVRSPGEEAGARMIGFIRDVTELRRAEAHQRMLMDELNHRVKNTLATVQSIAQQSLRGAGSIEDASERFMSRLMSLSHTHTLLTAARWDGAALTDVVLAELAPYRVASGPPRIQIEGPPVQLGPKAVQALGMAFHELATNAAKYGALSVPGGRVLVGWSLSPQAAEPRRLRIEWQERGGPAVVEPVQRGFGSRLVQRGLAHELRGVVELDFAAAGVRCVIDFPLSAADREAA
jgi:PAS domain S-box-containing protein